MTSGSPCLPLRLAAGVSPDTRETLFALLEAQPPAWDEIARLACTQPGLLHALLRGHPLDDDPRLERGLEAAARTRLECLGSDLLQLWLLNASSSAAPHHAHHHTPLVATLATELAQKLAYPYRDEARLGGLWHALETWVDEARPSTPDTIRPETRLARRLSLAQECGLAPPLLDALAAHHCSAELITHAHPLSRILWIATRLADDNAHHDRTGLARLAGMAPAELQQLDHEIRQRHPEASSFPLAACAPEPRPAHPTSAPAWREAAQRGLIHAALEQPLDDETLRERFELACELLCATRPALVMWPEPDTGLVRALPLTRHAALISWANELDLRRDDPSSRIALSMRSNTPTSSQEHAPQAWRSSVDWSLARWLKGPFFCLPFAAADGCGVCILSRPPDIFIDHAQQRLLTLLAGAAVHNHIVRAERQRAEHELSARLAQRHSEHAQRIAHEAGNPLSVIRSHLELFARHPATGAAHSDSVRLVQEELERIRQLIASLAHTPDTPAAAETALCHVPALLHDLRALYGATLFGQRDIHFELHAGSAAPPVAMPASALRQVLLNLLRNAAETLHPGGRCVVTLAGSLIVDNRPCLEIRIMDNGPGLPAERLPTPFAPHPSSKGDEHQGLGLAICREILAQWQATILCRSQAGVGTSFQLLVPLAESS